VRIVMSPPARRDEKLRPSRGKTWMLSGCVEDNGVLEAAREASGVM